MKKKSVRQMVEELKANPQLLHRYVREQRFTISIDYDALHVAAMRCLGGKVNDPYESYPDDVDCNDLRRAENRLADLLEKGLSKMLKETLGNAYTEEVE